jgi:hypothetical protein
MTHDATLQVSDETVRDALVGRAATIPVPAAVPVQAEGTEAPDDARRSEESKKSVLGPAAFTSPY